MSPCPTVSGVTEVGAVKIKLHRFSIWRLKVTSPCPDVIGVTEVRASRHHALTSVASRGGCGKDRMPSFFYLAVKWLVTMC